MNKQRVIILVCIFSIISLGAFFAIDWPRLSINDNLSDDVYNILLKYLLLTVVCERSLAVYNAINYEGKKKSLERRIKYFKEKLDEFRKLDLASKGNYIDSDPEVQVFLTQRTGATYEDSYMNLSELKEKDLEAIGQQTRAFSMRVLMFFGILISISGLSILNDLISLDAIWKSEAGLFQKRLIKFLDILITSALIGGGSKSMHELLSTIRSVLDRVKESQKT